MASGVFYANSSESIGLYGNTVYFGATYFEWFVFHVSETTPATPTGGSWDFTTNTGTPPVGWTALPPTDYSGAVWVSIAVVDSNNPTSLTWTLPGIYTPPNQGNIVFETSSTGSAKLPVGTTAQRDSSASAGYIRFNTSTEKTEVYNGTAWQGISSANGGPGNPFLFENDTTVTENYTITTGKNAMSAGPITINTGITVSIPVGSNWSIV
jgi:hypothetical protein